jgi:hypothetical protein
MSLKQGTAAVLVACAVAVGMTIVPPTNAFAKPSTGCPSGYTDPGETTFDETLTLPRIITGLAGNVYTVQDLADVFALIDANGDARVCLKAVSNLSGNSGKNLGAFYNGVDNHPRH